MTTLNVRHGRILSIASLAIILPESLPAMGSVTPRCTPTMRPAEGLELVLERRVDYQRRIEEITWRHTVRPARSARPKPTLDEVVPRAVTAARVADGRRKASAVATYDRRPITPAQPRAEAKVAGTGINRLA